jgi:large subunit ribosomal protein L21
MKYAILAMGQTQYWVEIGGHYTFNNLNLEIGEEFIFNKILLINDNSKVLLGQPYLKNVIIKAKVLKHFRSRKCFIYKMKPKKKTRKKQGYRQNLNEILITEINYL